MVSSSSTLKLTLSGNPITAEKVDEFKKTFTGVAVTFEEKKKDDEKKDDKTSDDTADDTTDETSGDAADESSEESKADNK